MRPAPGETPVPPAGPFRVLLVEDSEHDRRFFSRTIAESGPGFELTMRPDAESALETLKTERFDILVTDINMPGIDGLEFLRRAGPALDDTAVLIMSGSDDVRDVAGAVRLKVLDYLLKEPRDRLRGDLRDRLHGAAAHLTLVRENRRLESELRLRVAHLEQIHRQLPEALLAILNGKGEVLEISGQIPEAAGGSEREAAGRPVIEILRGMSPHLADEIAPLISEGATVSNRYLECDSSDGDARLWLFSLEPVQGGAPEGDERWILTLRDVTPAEQPDASATEFRGLIGRDPEILRMTELIRRVAPLPTSVLITGPTGAGKEVVARAIHAESDRSRRPFIAINCTALSSEILESELFGHVRGAFTGAVSARKGRFREADGGTLFLDEIGDTSESFQAKLLRALDSGQIEPVGQDRPVQVDVRVLCATNRDLEEMVRLGAFREDLYYRINVVHIRVPSLAERPGDLPLLVENFRREFGERFGKSVVGVSQEAMRALAGHSWPGNIRELRHVLEHAFVVTDGPTITLADLPRVITGRSAPAVGFRAEPSAAPAEREGAMSGSAPPEDEAGRISRALADSGGNIGKAAARLGVHRTTLWRKMRQLGIEV